MRFAKSQGLGIKVKSKNNLRLFEGMKMRLIKYEKILFDQDIALYFDGAA